MITDLIILIDKIKNILGYSPKRTIENAIEDLCDVLKSPPKFIQ